MRAIRATRITEEGACVSEKKKVNPIVDILCSPDRPPDWLIPDLLTQGSLVCLVGESGAGKSYISYTLALAVASGVRALSGIVPAGEPRRVLYFDDENGRADRDKYLKRSWIGLAHSNGMQEPDLALLLDNFWPVSFELGMDGWEDVAQGWVDFFKPHLIVVDTATPSFNIDDENNNAEAAKNIKRMRELMRSCDPVASAWILKHAKTRTEKGQIRTVRGAKVWKDMSDGMLFQVKAGGRPRKDGLSLTRLVPDKIRAYGLQQPIYITPKWTDSKKSGLMLDGSYSAGKEHRSAEDEEEG